MMRDLEFDVSRETYDLLGLYVSLVVKWNPKINLIGKSTERDIWERHISDSLQIWPIAREHLRTEYPLVWMDMGSGGGFPGIVLALLCMELAPNVKFHLIESDQRKCAFLRTVSRETNCPFAVHSKRIEDMDTLNADIVSARALASLGKLFTMSERHLADGAKLLFPKGEKWQSEVSEARESWSFSLNSVSSSTNSGSAILEIGDLARV